jgi:cytochrome bd-type quinol oxidase subunit 2
MKKNISFQFSIIKTGTIIFLVIFVLLIGLCSSLTVNAQESVGGNVAGSDVGGNTKTSPTPSSSSNIFTLKNPLKVDSIGGLIQSFIQIFTYLVIIFAVLMLIWTGFQYVVVSTQGDTKKISELHNRLMWIVIGVAIVIGARVIVEVVINTLSATGTVSPGIIDSANKAIQVK